MFPFHGFQEVKEIPYSGLSTEKCYHRFFNLTERTVDVIWINYDGVKIPYKTLSAGQYVDVNTFKNHPWIVVDHSTRDWLALDGKAVYFPLTFKEYFEIKFKQKPFPLSTKETVRTRVNVTSPLYSLRQNCLKAVVKNLRNSEEIDRLELPKSLINDLRVLSRK